MNKAYIYFYFLLIIPCLLLGLIGIVIEFFGVVLALIGNKAQSLLWRLKAHLELK